MKPSPFSATRGFTLLELLIVVAVVGLIAAVVLPKFGNVKDKAYVAAMKNDLRNLANAQEFYFDVHDTYGAANALPGFHLTDGVSVATDPAPTASAEQWSATLVHAKTDNSCEITVGKSAEAQNKIRCTSDGSSAVAEAPAGYAYWRVAVTANNGSGYVVIAELGMRSAPGGSSVATGGTEIGTFSWKEAAFDGISDGMNNYAYKDTPAGTLGYHFVTPVEIVEVAVTARLAYQDTEAPRDFTVDFSEDGTNWTTAWSVTNQTGWAEGETRVFTRP